MVQQFFLLMVQVIDIFQELHLGAIVHNKFACQDKSMCVLFYVALPAVLLDMRVEAMRQAAY